MKDKNMIVNKLKLVFQIFGWIAAALGVVFFLIILIGGGSPDAPRATSILALVLGFIYFVFFFTASLSEIQMGPSPSIETCQVYQ